MCLLNKTPEYIIIFLLIVSKNIFEIYGSSGPPSNALVSHLSFYYIKMRNKKTNAKHPHGNTSINSSYQIFGKIKANFRVIPIRFNQFDRFS